MKVYLLQMTSIDNIEYNLNMIDSLCQNISPCTDDSQLICLPENALYMRIQEGEQMISLDLSDSVFSRIKKLAKQLNAVFHIGSSPVKTSKKLVNASILVFPSGEHQISYEKIHLFDIQLENERSIRESDVFQHGLLPRVFELNTWLFGQSICYDVRFSELYNFYARIPVDALLVPSAFLVTTGQAHWHTLLKARAIESQCYVLAAAQAGVHQSSKGKRATFGHSLIIDPWGNIIAEGSPDKPEVISADLDKKFISSVRQQIPMHLHRRWHL
jgi:predicted amidohydrolase